MMRRDYYYYYYYYYYVPLPLLPFRQATNDEVACFDGVRPGW